MKFDLRKIMLLYSVYSPPPEVGHDREEGHPGVVEQGSVHHPVVEILADPVSRVQGYVNLWERKKKYISSVTPTPGK